MNLFLEGDFENNILDDWMKRSWIDGGEMILIDDKVHHGNKALMIRAETIENDISVTKNIQVKPETFYRLSGWIAAADIGEGRVGANLSIMGGYIRTKDIAGTKDWQEIELIFKTGPCHEVINVGARLGFYYNANTGTAFFDDLSLVELKEIPEIYTNLDPIPECVDTLEKEKEHITLAPWFDLFKLIWFILSASFLLFFILFVFKIKLPSKRENK